MATSRTAAYHTCSCGEEFESTAELLEHARSDHGIWIA
jgi:hypothetical protein